MYVCLCNLNEPPRSTLTGDDLPVSYLRLLAPPLQLFSAAMWQVVQQGLVDHYGMLEEFVTMVTELVPELMSYSQRAQLILGLRSRLVLEMCRGEHPVDLPTIEPHLDRIKAPISTAKDHHVEESEVNFVELVHTLLENPSEREHFFQEIFPVHFGSKYDTALEMLVWEFISRLEELLPLPDFTQVLQHDTPSFLDECLQSFSPPESLKAVLEHRRNLGHFEEKGRFMLLGSFPPSLWLFAVRILRTNGVPWPSEGLGRRNTETSSNGSNAQEKRRQNSAATFAHDGVDTIDLSPSEDPVVTDPATSENSLVLKGGRVLRKRKHSAGLEVSSKQSMEVSAFL
uniref:TERF1-interacting nuclear factor 2 N-terminal domain-containing protein n=1 Tax=Myripristis murdjan TaxID=586833 RepID=A0A667X8C5_9TELE